jgi:hypothetical protein
MTKKLIVCTKTDSHTAGEIKEFDDAEHGECYQEAGTSKSKIEVLTIAIKDAAGLFKDLEDGDGDECGSWGRRILLITTLDGEVLYDAEDFDCIIHKDDSKYDDKNKDDVDAKHTAQFELLKYLEAKRDEAINEAIKDDDCAKCGGTGDRDAQGGTCRVCDGSGKSAEGIIAMENKVMENEKRDS